MRKVLVTGSNRGIGLELVRQCLARGDRVLAACRKPGHATELTKLAGAHPGRLSVLPLEMAKPASIANLASEIAIVTDALDLAIGNAGVLHSGERFGELDAARLADSFAVNSIAPLLLAQALAPLLERGEHPVLVNVSSVIGSIASRDAFSTPGYAMSKAALNMGTRLASFELAARGIVAFVVHPGWVRTDMGGPKAEIDVHEAAAGILAVADGATAASAGRFFDYRGDELPW